MENKYVQTTFDKAFVNVVNYLKSQKKLRYSELAEKIQLTPQNLQNVLKGERGVPLQKISLCIFVLTKEYNASESYLNTGKGQLLKEHPPVKVEEVPQYAAAKKENKDLLDRIEQLEKANKMLQQVVDAQSKVIETLQADGKSAKK